MKCKDIVFTCYSFKGTIAERWTDYFSVNQHILKRRWSCERFHACATFFRSVYVRTLNISGQDWYVSSFWREWRFVRTNREIICGLGGLFLSFDIMSWYQVKEMKVLTVGAFHRVWGNCSSGNDGPEFELKDLRHHFLLNGRTCLGPEWRIHELPHRVHRSHYTGWALCAMFVQGMCSILACAMNYDFIVCHAGARRQPDRLDSWNVIITWRDCQVLTREACGCSLDWMSNVIHSKCIWTSGTHRVNQSYQAWKPS